MEKGVDIGKLLTDRILNVNAYGAAGLGSYFRLYFSQKANLKQTFLQK